MNSLFTEAAKLFDDVEHYAGPITERYEGNEVGAAREQLAQALSSILTVSSARLLGHGTGVHDMPADTSDIFEQATAGALAAAIVHVALGIKRVVDGKQEGNRASALRWAHMVGRHIDYRLKMIESGHAERVPVDGTPGNLGIPTFDYREHLRSKS